MFNASLARIVHLPQPKRLHMPFVYLYHMLLKISTWVFVFGCLASFQGRSQTADSAVAKTKHWHYLLLGDLYYGYDFAQPAGNKRQEAFASYNRHNQLALNAAIAKISYISPRLAFHLGAVGGTYSRDNYANEPGLLKHLFEAQVAIKLLSQQELWLHAGVLPSHIGFESALATDNHTLSRSLLAENSPYYSSGLQLRYAHPKHWQFSLLVLNGWQRLRFDPQQRIPALGTQLTRETDQWLWNWSTFTGWVDPDSLGLWRSFHNFFVQRSIHAQWHFTMGFDIGWQKMPAQWAVWYSPVGILKFQPNKQWAAAGRLEYYHDPQAANLRFNSPSGFSAWGLSANVDRKTGRKGLLRAEIRYLLSPSNSLNSLSSNQQSNLTALIAAVLKLDGDLPKR